MSAHCFCAKKLVIFIPKQISVYSFFLELKSEYAFIFE